MEVMVMAKVMKTLMTIPRRYLHLPQINDDTFSIKQSTNHPYACMPLSSTKLVNDVTTLMQRDSINICDRNHQNSSLHRLNYGLSYHANAIEKTKV
jgi:hypothetical protein